VPVAELCREHGMCQIRWHGCVHDVRLGIEVDFSLPAERVIRSLDKIIEWRGKPGSIRVDNGPEYISAKL
jgi:transposase InsO family protein